MQRYLELRCHITDQGNNQDMGGDREGAEREAISLGILVTWCTLSTSLPVSVQTYSSIFTGQFAVV